MDEPKNEELQENHSLLEFPCDFPIKIMGKADPKLHDAILKILAAHAPDFHADDLKLNKSKNGNYNAFTAIIHAKNQLQLDAIYQALSDHELVLMAL